MAFVANNASTQEIYFRDDSGLTQITPGTRATYGRELQLNNNNQIGAVSIIGGARRARIWDANNPGSNVIIARSPRQLSSAFDGLASFASINNDGQMTFAGLEVPTFFGKSYDFTKNEYPEIPVNTSGAYTAIVAAVATSTGLSTSDVESVSGAAITSIVSTIPAFPAPLSGIDIPLWLTIMPQFSLGLPFDIELTFRGGSTTTDEDDEIKFGGFGAKIGVNQFIPTVPLVFPAISIGYYATSFEIGDMLKAKNSIITLQVSKSVPLLTLYGGFGIESSSVDVDYVQVFDEPGLPDVPIKFSLEGDNGFRTILGFRLKLLLLSINYDYNIGEFTAHNIGIGLTFR